jgi:hypothetical protein
MLSPGDRAIVKAEIERLQKAQKGCTDEGIRKKIDVWIEEQKRKLAAGDYSPCPICGKACPPAEAVTNAEGRLLHKACYRASRISPSY